MTTGIMTTVLFVVTMALEMGVVRSLPEPWGLFPLMLISGVLVMHRGDLFLGMFWLAATAILVHPWGEGIIASAPLLAAAAAALPLQQKIFTNRSVYALLGLGTVLYVTMIATALLLVGLHSIWSDEPWMTSSFFHDRLIEGVALLVGLYIGVDIVRRVSTWSKQTFFLHR